MKLNQADIVYYTAKSNNTLRMTYPVESYSVTKTADSGFTSDYPLFFPQGVTFNVIWPNSFDDYISAGTVALGAADNTTAAFGYWTPLDLSGIVSVTQGSSTPASCASWLRSTPISVAS